MQNAWTPTGNQYGQIQSQRVLHRVRQFRQEPSCLGRLDRGVSGPPALAHRTSVVRALECRQPVGRDREQGFHPQSVGGQVAHTEGGTAWTLG